MLQAPLSIGLCLSSVASVVHPAEVGTLLLKTTEIGRRATGADGSGAADGRNPLNTRAQTRKLYFNIADDPAQRNCGPRSEITKNKQRKATARAATADPSEMRGD